MRLSTQTVRLQVFFAALMVMPSLAQAANTAVSGHADAASLVAYAFQNPHIVSEELMGGFNDFVDRLKTFAPATISIALLLVPVLAVTLLEGLIAVLGVWASGADREKPNGPSALKRRTEVPHARRGGAQKKGFENYYYAQTAP